MKYILIIILMIFTGCVPKEEIIKQKTSGEIHYLNVDTHIDNETGNMVIRYNISLDENSKHLIVKYYYYFKDEWHAISDENENDIEDRHSVSKFNAENSIVVTDGITTPIEGKYKLAFYVDGKFKTEKEVDVWLR